MTVIYHPLKQPVLTWNKVGALTNPLSSITQESRGLKRSRSPDIDGDLQAGDLGDDGKLCAIKRFDNHILRA